MLKLKKINILIDQYLKNQVELAAKYYGITQSEFIKDAIKIALIDYVKIKNIDEALK